MSSRAAVKGGRRDPTVERRLSLCRRALFGSCASGPLRLLCVPTHAGAHATTSRGAGPDAGRARRMRASHALLRAARARAGLAAGRAGAVWNRPRGSAPARPSSSFARPGAGRRPSRTRGRGCRRRRRRRRRASRAGAARVLRDEGWRCDGVYCRAMCTMQALERGVRGVHASPLRRRCLFRLLTLPCSALPCSRPQCPIPHTSRLNGHGKKRC